MNFKQYQKEAINFLVRSNNNYNELLARLTLGLVGESGKIASKIKKKLRGDYSYKKFSFEEDIKKTIGNLCWYLANFLDFLDLDFNEILKENIKKLTHQRGKNE